MLLMILKHGNKCSVFKPFCGHIQDSPPPILCSAKVNLCSGIGDYSSVANAFPDPIPIV